MRDVHEIQKGYIEGGYRFFFLEDQEKMNFDYHYHSFHKCLIVLEGKIKYEVEGMGYDLGAGDIIWVPSYEAHKVEVSDDIPYKRIVVYLSKQFVSLLSQKLEQGIIQMGDRMSHSIKLSLGQQKELMKLFKYEKYVIKKGQENSIKVENNIKQESHHKQMEKNHSINTSNNINFDESLNTITDFIKWMNVYFSLVNGHENVDFIVSNKNSQVKQEWMLTTMTYIKEHLKEELTIDDIAKQVYLSKYYFMRKFKENSGISIHQYIIRQRLIHARYLMKQGMTLTDIAYQSGFRDYSTFARAFKKTYNKSPRELQKLNPTTNFE